MKVNKSKKRSMAALLVLIAMVTLLTGFTEVYAEEESTESTEATESEFSRQLVVTGIQSKYMEWSTDVECVYETECRGPIIEHMAFYKGVQAFVATPEDFYLTFVFDDKVNFGNHYQNGALANDSVQLFYAKSWAANIYQFANKQECEAYLNGELDASAALNYEEVKNKTNLDYGKHDSNIPVPTKAYISSISFSNVTASVQYSPTEIEDFKKRYNVDELYCDIEMEFFYQYLSQTQINNRICSPNMSEYGPASCVNRYGIMFSETTCGTLFNSIKLSNGSIPDLYKSVACADSGSEMFYSPVQELLTFNSVPPDYSNLYYNDFNLFTFEHHMTFICAQVKIRTYYVDESTGDKVYSDDLYIRRFVFDSANEDYGSTYTRMEEDEEGNQDYIDSGFLDEDGNDSYYDGGYIDADNLLEYIKDGFGLTGDEGYVHMMQMFFRGVPDYIWGLVATAMTVSIFVILFKALRGM